MYTAYIQGYAALIQVKKGSVLPTAISIEYLKTNDVIQPADQSWQVQLSNLNLLGPAKEPFICLRLYKQTCAVD